MGLPQPRVAAGPRSTGALCHPRLPLSAWRVGGRFLVLRAPFCARACLLFFFRGLGHLIHSGRPSL
eukprot:9815366-Lingulodinium_polyedra.AAC.1